MSVPARSSSPSVLTGPTLTVDLSAVVANARLFTARTEGQLMAVVKADGFGHGAADVARAALTGGATWLGVTSIDEAAALREAGLRAPVLSWLNPVDTDVSAAVSQHIDLAVPSLEHLAAFTTAARRAGGRVRAHLHADVGMARDGAPASEWRQLCDRARDAERSGLLRIVGVMGHLGCADDPGDPHNDAGIRAFALAADAATRAGLRPRVRHLAATAATLTDERTHFDLSRVGAGLVGIDPSRTTRLRTAMTLAAPVVSVRDVPAGTAVGYGHTHVTTAPTRLALLPIGYADGIPRSTSGHGWVQVSGRRCPLVGRVSMDQVVVDVGAASVRPGDVAVVFGPGDDGEPTLADWAAWAQTIEHELVTGIGARVARRVVGRCEHRALSAPRLTVLS